MNPAAFMPRDDDGRFVETHDEGTPCCGADFQNTLMPSGTTRMTCPECGNGTGEPALRRVFTDDEDRTCVDLHVSCVECGHEWDKEELFEEVT